MKSRHEIWNANYLLHTRTKFQIPQIIIFLKLMSSRNIRRAKDIVEENGNWIIKKLWPRGVVITIKFYDIFITLQNQKQS